MARKGPWELINRADGKSIGTILTSIVGGFIFGIGQGANNILQSFIDIFVEPAGATASGSAGIISSFLGGIGSIIEAGAQTAVATLAPGSTWAVGPLTFAISVAAGGAGLWVMGKILQRGATSDIFIGTFTDAPGVGTEEDDDSEA